MAWLVFGMFFLASDHAPKWVYILFALGFLFDTLKDHAAAREERTRHLELMAKLHRGRK